MSRMIRSLLLVSAVATSVLPGAAKADPPLTVTWSVEDRLRDRNGDKALDPATAVSDENTTVLVRLRVGGVGTCEGDLHWRLGDAEVVPTSVRGCTFELPVKAGAREELTLSSDGAEVRETIEVRDHLVVSIGDSVASGEGNPERRASGGRWLESRCHRSMLSGAALAAVALERGDRHGSLTFHALACSGATVRSGLLGTYRGVAPDRARGPLAAQIDDVGRLAAGRPIDALLLSIGANDVHFSALVKFCAVVKNCEKRRFDPERPFRESSNPKTPTAAAQTRIALRELRASYRDLAASLGKHINAERVVAVEYFDALNDAGGNSCAATLPGIDAKEAGWAQSDVLAPLNAELRRAATKYGWRLASGVSEAFRTHGICARGTASWVTRLEESVVRQRDLVGTLHPNDRGHLATAALVTPVLAATLGADVGTGIAELAGQSETQHPGFVRWWLIPLSLLVGALAVPVARRVPAFIRSLGSAVRSALDSAVARGAIVIIVAVGALAGFIAAGILWSWWPALAVLLAAVSYLLGRRVPSGELWFPFAAALLVGLTFVVDASELKVGGAMAGMAFALAFLGVRTASTDEPHDWARPVGRFLLSVVLSVVAFAAAFVGGAVIAGHALADRTEPINAGWLNFGVLVLAFAVAWLVAGWIRAFARMVVREEDRLILRVGVGPEGRRVKIPPIITSLVVAALVVAIGLAALSARPTPRESDAEASAQARQRGQGLYDLLLVIDPADPIGAGLIRTARRDLAAGKTGRLFTQPADVERYDVAYGLAVPQQRVGKKPLWRLVEPPTTDFRELTDSLAGIPLSGGRASGSYGRILVDTLDNKANNKIRWRKGAQRGMAFMLEKLPRLSELDAYVATGGRSETLSGWTDPAPACRDLVRGSGGQSFPESRRVPIAWEDALAQHCKRRLAARSPDALGQAPEPLLPVALHVVSPDKRRERAARWWTWARALDGRFYASAPVREVEDAERALAGALDLHLGKPVGELAQVADVFRPHLRFDADDKLRPVDVDWLLEHPSEGTHHNVCDHDDLVDNCERIKNGSQLVGSLDEYIDFGVGNDDLSGDRKVRSRMYVHTREKDGRLYLGYWWYLPYNSSPWRRELNCLPGFTFADLSCFDHEGDWEGVTVVLRMFQRRGVLDPYALANLEPQAVIYDAHGQRIRWDWQDVQLASDPKSYATHPVVYVAAGSHAAYPAPCGKRECDQALGNHSLGEGGFDGSTPWQFNSREQCNKDQIGEEQQKAGGCLISLPSTRDGRLGVLWNAFPGRWGAAVCSRVGKVCSQTDGPFSPSKQARFSKPWVFEDGRVKRLAQFRRKYGGAIPRSQRRWPPESWPVTGDQAVPESPALPARAD